MYLPEFLYYRPKTLQEACELLEKSKNGAAIAGGTDVLVEIKKGIRLNDELVSLGGIRELKLIKEGNGALYIGAGVKHNEVATSPLVKNNFFAISETALKIGTDQIRNTGTIGGNLCTGASCCDMAPVLIAFNASVEIASSRSKRIELLKDFFITHKKTLLEKAEIMAKIIVPRLPKGSGVSFLKFGLRDAASISVTSVAVYIKLDGNICAGSNIVIGAVAPVPLISKNAINVLNGTQSNELVENSSRLVSIGETAAKDSLPIDDIRGSANYRRNVVKILTQRAIIEAVKRAKYSLLN